MDYLLSREYETWKLNLFSVHSQVDTLSELNSPDKINVRIHLKMYLTDGTGMHY